MSRGPGADGHAEADLAGALGDADEHDVHDADAADDERDQRDASAAGWSSAWTSKERGVTG